MTLEDVGTVRSHCPRCKGDVPHEMFRGVNAGHVTSATRCVKCRLIWGHPGAENPPQSPSRMEGR